MPTTKRKLFFSGGRAVGWKKVAVQSKKSLGAGFIGLRVLQGRAKGRPVSH